MKAFTAGGMATIFTVGLFLLLISTTTPDKGGFAILFVTAFIAVWFHARRLWLEAGK